MKRALRAKILLWPLVIGALGTTGLWTGCTGRSASDERANSAANAKPGNTADASRAGGKTDGDQANPPVLGPSLAIRLTDEEGEAFGSRELRGKAWIATFIFTRCGETCPAQTAQFAALQEALQKHPQWDDIRLVSLTVDPKHDTPEVLKEYGKNAGADPAHWKFLTGDQIKMWRLCKEGFKLPVLDVPDNPNSLIVHSQSFVLVDRNGRIRGYYDGLEADDREKLKRDLEIVLADEPPAYVYKRAPVASRDEVSDPPWLASRGQEQLATVDQFKVFYDFQFADRMPESGIRFDNKVVPCTCKVYKDTHYDHGNGVVVADVDGDGLYDLYFVSQVGGNELWRNLGDGKFENITEKAGVAVTEPIGVTASFADIDNDGDPDLYVTTVRGGNFLFENDGTGKFKDISKESGLDYVGHSSGAVFFDYNRDGLLDLFLTNVGKYTEEEISLAPTNYKGEPQGEAYDYHVGFTGAFSAHLNPERSEQSILFKNLGNNRFADVSQEVELIDKSWTGDASPIDVNEDGWPDLYVTNMQGHDEYYENVEGKRFVKKSREVFPKTPWGAMGIKVFDYDNDGRMDVYIVDMHSDMYDTQIPPEKEKLKSLVQGKVPESMLRSGGMSIFGNAFYRNEGGGKFREISDEIGAENFWPWGLSVGDLNADGFQDAFVASSMNFDFRYAVNSLLLNNRGEKFLDSEFIVGVEPRRDGATEKIWYELDCDGADKGHEFCKKYGHHGRVVLWEAMGSRSSVIFDLDDDGDLDIVTNEFNSMPLVMVSNLTDKKDIQYLKVKLVGTKSNRSGLGAKVTVRAGEQTYTQVHDGKSGYLSQSLAPLYFGLDDAENVDEITIDWPSGRKQVMAGPIPANQLLTVTETEE